MGDYYKYKKILIILMIISCGFSIIKNIFKTKVEATEAVEVTPSWNDGNYTYLADNNYINIVEDYKNLQIGIISVLYELNNTYPEETQNSIKNLYNLIVSRANSGLDSRFIYFSRNLTDSQNRANIMYQVITPGRMSSNYINYHDATLENGYKISNTPFYEFSRNSTLALYGIDRTLGTTLSPVTTGNASIPCACVGVYVPEWLDLFRDFGLIQSVGDYESALSEILETNQLNYTANLYTKEAVQNTYNYLHSDNVDTISSSGITQPGVTEPDISDAFDSLSELLTNDNATTKAFTLTLPNGYQQAFSLSPDFLRNSLTRVGGGALVTIIETLWYIGLYGLMIFTYLKIIGALMAGDLDSVTGVLSPVNSVVNSSLEVTGAFRTSGGDESSFRIRKG